MYLCTCVSEEGGDGKTACSETPSLLSYTRRYVSFAEVGSVCRMDTGFTMSCLLLIDKASMSPDAFFLFFLAQDFQCPRVTTSPSLPPACITLSTSLSSSPQ
jgi:hypothetical protein